MKPARRMAARSGAALLAALAVSWTLASVASTDDWVELEVRATAYNSLASQTNQHPRITAWGDVLKPGMKAIAVSRDLVRMGLRHGVEVEISGLPGVYVVRDKMAKRWQKKIDIYMGEDRRAARKWGKRNVTIRWRRPE